MLTDFFLQGNIKNWITDSALQVFKWMQKLTIFNNICCDFCMTFYRACTFLQCFTLRRKICLAYNAQNKYIYFDFEFSSFEQAFKLRSIARLTLLFNTKIWLPCSSKHYTILEAQKETQSGANEHWWWWWVPSV